MGDKREERLTPLLVYWIIYQSDQLEEEGVYCRRDFKNPRIGRKGWWHLLDLLRLKAR